MLIHVKVAARQFEDPSMVGHGVPGIRAEVHQDLMHVGWVEFDQTRSALCLD